MSLPLMNESFSLLLLVTSLWLSNGMTAATLGPLDTTATPIQEERFVTVGGIEQWITIRGANRTNPVLLIVHGRAR